MKNRRTLIVSLGVTLVIVLGILVLWMSKTKIVIVDGKDTIKRGVTADSIISDMNNGEISFKENNKAFKYSYSDLGITTKIDSEQSKKINRSFIVNYSNIDFEYDYTNLKNELSKLNKDRNKTEYAKIEKHGSKLSVSDIVKGNYLDIGKIYDYIVSNLAKHSIFVDLTEYYENIDSTKPTYEKLIAEKDKVNNTYIKYTNGYEIKLDNYIEYLDIKNNKISLTKDENKLNELRNTIDKTIEHELIEYDTVGKSREFKTHSGKTIAISKGTYGNIFSSDDETEYILEKFRKFKNESNREPIYSQKMPDEIGDTYIEVDINNQHVYHYVNGKLKSDSPCVTGTLDGKHNTPTGIYYILEKKNGKTLYPSGSTKGTFVNKWMRVMWTGVGLHDAYWRGAFGGTIYKTNGSHGCINLPSNYAYKLYDEIKMNEPVIIY